MAIHCLSTPFKQAPAMEKALVTVTESSTAVVDTSTALDGVMDQLPDRSRLTPIQDIMVALYMLFLGECSQLHFLFQTSFSLRSFLSRK